MGAGRPLQQFQDSGSGLTPRVGSELGRTSGRKPLPAVLDGTDKAEELACVSRLLDAAKRAQPPGAMLASLSAEIEWFCLAEKWNEIRKKIIFLRVCF